MIGRKHEEGGRAPAPGRQGGENQAKGKEDEAQIIDRKNSSLLILAALTGLLGASAATPAEPAHKGKSLKEWAAQLKDAKEEKRSEAADALAEIGGKEAALSLLGAWERAPRARSAGSPPCWIASSGERRGRPPH